MSAQRRLAQRLIDHAAVVMPAGRADWAEAMRAEFAVMAKDHEALVWAGGCVWASYCERIQPMQLFLKSLVRAFAVWLAIPAFFLVMLLIDPMSKSPFDVLKFARLLAEFYGGIFATLWTCELLIARFWSVPGQVFKKTLARTIAVWLWPMGFETYTLIRALTLNDPIIRAYIDANLGAFTRQTMIDFAGHGGGSFAAIFVPLLVCEILIARFWRARQERAA